MSTIRNPPTAPPVATGGPGDGDPIGRATVTRNVPPKRVAVLPGNTLYYAGAERTEDSEPFLIPGPTADALALQGHVVIVSHEEVDAWNGKEGKELFAKAHAAIDAQHEKEGTKRTHDHGFETFKYVDGGEADYTSHRQRVAQDNQLRGEAATDEQVLGKKGA